MRRLVFTNGLAGLVIALAGFVPASAAPPVSEIVEKGIQRAEQQEKDMIGWQFDQTVIAEALDKKNEPTKRHEIDMVITFTEKGPEYKIVAERGEPLIPQFGEKDRQKISKEIEANRNELKLRDKLKYYHVELVGEGELQGKPVYILKFYPKKDVKPANRFDKVLGNLKGRIWVDKEDYGVLQSEGELVKPTELAWFLAKLHQLEFKYSAQPIQVGWVPQWINLHFRLNLGPINVHHRQFMTMDNYRKVAN